jgi:hypothetical protein
MVFTFYLDEITIDVKTGSVTRHENFFFLEYCYDNIIKLYAFDHEGWVR